MHIGIKPNVLPFFDHIIAQSYWAESNVQRFYRRTSQLSNIGMEDLCIIHLCTHPSKEWPNNMQDIYLFLCLCIYRVHFNRIRTSPCNTQQFSRSNSVLRIQSIQEQSLCKACWYSERSFSTVAFCFHTKVKALKMLGTESFFIY